MDALREGGKVKPCNRGVIAHDEGVEEKFEFPSDDYILRHGLGKSGEIPDGLDAPRRYKN